MGLILKNSLIVFVISIDKTAKKEVTRIDRRKALIPLSAAAIAAIISSIALIAYAANNGQESSNGLMMPERCGWSNGPEMRGWGRHRFLRGHHRFVEVSEEYEENVISIAESDPDVQELLDDGYNITRVMPIIKARVEASGDVVTKATSAIVILSNDTTGKAFVWVNVEEGTVTRIVILTRTVIEKP